MWKILPSFFPLRACLTHRI
ncbi:rCG45046 [Rattus norvegicus]|uniref:RCG45046 n=1 Tax=Rattus norvegicus TaxID=10116 RepID=A6KR32_RAT|nr:rCG45046 [Rattus norvegicus]